MKTVTSTLIAFSLTIFTATAHSQAMFISHKISETAGTGKHSVLITGVKMESAANGFSFQWNTSNEIGVTRYEIQMSENTSNFSTVKRVTVLPNATNLYTVRLHNTIIFSDTVYFRIKTVFADGSISYTAASAFAIAGNN